MKSTRLIIFEPCGKKVEVPYGTTILDAASSNNIELDSVCGGACACATCHVYVKEGLDGLDPKSAEESEMLEMAMKPLEISRLACQTEVLTDLVVEIPSA